MAKTLSQRAGCRLARNFIFAIQMGRILSFRAAEIVRKFRFELARDRLRECFGVLNLDCRGI
nr:hypothetical protein [uncultured Campylobacter sp.]